MTGTTNSSTRLRNHVPIAISSRYQRPSPLGMGGGDGGGGNENGSLVGTEGSVVGVSEETVDSAVTHVCSVEGSSVNTERV